MPTVPSPLGNWRITTVSLLAFWEHGTTSSKLCVSFLIFICEANKNEKPSVRVGGTTTTNKAE
ncbi:MULTISPECIES: hypothetical protein [Bacillus cereus group]|uniref:hypothetical protein n=1 Tax=Bacillus cereus group TaxID=86661 RepID=UPI000B4BF380|nr:MULTISPECIES: hypothetical protein [Bacillus cereus group]ASK17787.1 hypothetical protein BA201_28130 [Bacillus cereus]MBL3786268.1 hypothetical protein [Bacillus cereus]MBL3802882.1 hypothetical protein [Bacillus cereus]MBL3817989.1 hypothetical protein [Bacillus cereus]MDX5733790.1 hypothetical protein [Bacillus cereus group sp. BfR-BA-02491]